MKNNKAKAFVLSSLALLALVSCGGTPVSVESTLPPMEEEVANEIKAKLAIEGGDAVYGNIYLPKEMDGATITWKSDKPEVISDALIGKAEAGVVTRQVEDTSVTLTAKIEKDGKGASYSQTLNVIKAPKALSEDDYEGYLFTHFIGEGQAGGEQIFFALAENGLNFKDTNNRQAVLTSQVGEKGVRDPYIYRSPEGDRFFIIATDLCIYNRGGWKTNAQGYTEASVSGSENLVLWESKDLVHWSEPSLLHVAPERAGMAWAPEMIFDENAGEYVIYFSSCIMDEERVMKAKGDAVYSVHTRDFKHFSDTKLFIDNQDDPDGKKRNIIDATIIKIGDYYYSASKDGDNNEDNGGIRIMKTADLSDSPTWEKVMNLEDTGLKISSFKGETAPTNKNLEGPEFFKLNKKDWANPEVPEYCLMADQYQNGAGYLPFLTTDIEDKTNANNSWKMMQSGEYSFDSLTKRHGAVLRLTQEEVAKVKEAFLPE